MVQWVLQTNALVPQQYTVCGPVLIQGKISSIKVSHKVSQGSKTINECEVFSPTLVHSDKVIHHVDEQVDR